MTYGIVVSNVLPAVSFCSRLLCKNDINRRPSLYAVSRGVVTPPRSPLERHSIQHRAVRGVLWGITGLTVVSVRPEFTMMAMTFGVSTRVTLLFDFWNVNGPAGMVLSVFVVLLLTVFYELLKVSRVWLGASSKLAQPQSPYALPASPLGDCGSVLNTSQSSLTHTESQPPAPNTRNRWLLHGVQTLLHMLQVTLGYMLMLCVMSYNAWIFIGVVAGSVLGYFISFPLLGRK